MNKTFKFYAIGSVTICVLILLLAAYGPGSHVISDFRIVSDHPAYAKSLQNGHVEDKAAIPFRQKLAQIYDSIVLGCSVPNGEKDTCALCRRYLPGSST